MSWDVWLETEVDGHAVELVDSINYTHNCNGMIRDAGFAEWPYELGGMTSAEFCAKLNDTLHTLRANRAKYEAMNPENGWGSYDSLLPVLTEILDKFSRFPSGEVKVSA